MKSALLFPFTFICLVMCVSLLSVFSAGAATAGTLPHRQPAHPPTGQYKSTRTWFLPTTPFTIQRFSGKTCTQTYKSPESFTEMLHFLLHLGEKCQNPRPATSTPLGQKFGRVGQPVAASGCRHCIAYCTSWSMAALPSCTSMFSHSPRATARSKSDMVF